MQEVVQQVVQQVVHLGEIDIKKKFYLTLEGFFSCQDPRELDLPLLEKVKLYPWNLMISFSPFFVVVWGLSVCGQLPAKLRDQTNARSYYLPDNMHYQRSKVPYAQNKK